MSTSPAGYAIVGRIRKAHGIRGEVVVEPITDGFRGSSHDGHMSETDFALSHRLHGLRHPMHRLAHGDAVGRRPACHVAVEANPVDRADEAVVVVFLPGRKLSRETRDVQVPQIPRVVFAAEF